VSGDTPDIVLNEFGDLSRKARRELEARGIDPDTAVVEYIAATGQMPVITPEMAAAAKAEAQAEAAAAKAFESEVVEEHIAPVEEPAVEIDTPVQPVVEQTSIPPVSVPVTSAETGPIEPLVVAPALDSGSLSAVEETLAAVSDQTGEIVSSGFDSLVTVETSDVPIGPTKGEARRLARKEKKAQALAAKQEKVAAAAESKAAAAAASEALAAEKVALKAEEEAAREQSKAEAAELAAREAEAVAAAEARETELAAEREAARLSQEALEAEEAQAAREQQELQDAEDAEIVEEQISEVAVDELDTVNDDDDEEKIEPQTISEATAAIAIAEAVAAAEAVVEAGEVNIEYGNLANSVPATTGSISVISNALILPTLPETTGSIAPINPTGEIVITGSILIPSSVSQVGANLENLDTSDIDVIKDDQEVAPTQGMAPVSAATAVSAYNISSSVVTTPRGMNERLPFILSITAAGLAVGVVALFVAGYFLGLF
jgi:chemotaxis protein histidine kinase CheA